MQQLKLGRIWRIFDKRAKLKFAAATAGSVTLGLLDSIGVLLILPLVNLAAGQPLTGPLESVAAGLGLDSPAQSLVGLTLAVMAIFIFKDLAALAYTWWSTGFIALERVRTSTRLMRHFLTQPYTQANQRASSELVRTMTDSVGVVFNSTVNGLMQVVIHGFTLLWLVSALMLVAPRPTAVLVLYFAVSALLFTRLVRRASQRFGHIMAEESLNAWKWALGAFGALKEIHLRQAQPYFVSRYANASFLAANAQRSGNFIATLPKYLLEILFIVAIGLVLVLENRSDRPGEAIGLLAMFVAAGFRAMPSVTGLLAGVTSLRVGGPSLDLVSKEFHEPKMPSQPQDSAERGTVRLKVNIEFRDVSFQYPGSDHMALESVSFSLRRGGSLGIVGPSGSGKTTLVDLLLGFHRPTSGAILVDGIDIGTELSSWRRQVGYVPQDVFVLDTSLAENVAFDADPGTIDSELLRESLAKAQLDASLVRSMSHATGSLGERGSKLSGGQRQRVGIARALYRRPTLLVLDEATSALDNATENDFVEALREVGADLTTVVVAHRLSTVRHLESVLFLKSGRVVARGSFDQLLQSSPDFAELVRLGSLGDGARRMKKG